jgi:hypothetical protein
MKATFLSRFCVCVAIIMACSVTYSLQASAAEESGLAKEIQNPIANVITLPFQANFNNGVGPYDRRYFNFNIQPVIPFEGKKWNVISRTIIPVNSVPLNQTDSEFGIGDTALSLFWTPADAGNPVWGVGPIFLLPTASNPEVLGSEKWSVGPTGVLFYTMGNWTMGGVASNVWSVAGSGSRDDVNLLTLQYFVNYNLKGGWVIGTSPIITANWKADSDNTWTIPWGLQVGKLTSFGSRPVNLSLGFYHNSRRPDGAAKDQVRFQLNLIFPAAKK